MQRLFTILSFVLVLSATAENPLVEPTLKEVSYGPHEKHKLYLWKAEGEGPTPVLVNIHGGGWLRGDGIKEMHKYPFLASGISVVTISYRLAPEHPVPAPLLDAARAIQFVRSKAEEWGLDKERLAVMGSSAGGCTSLWLACHDDLADPDAEDPVARESTKPLCALGKAAQTFIDARMVKEFVDDQALAHGMIWRTVGASSAQDAIDNYDKYKELYTEYSAYNHLDKDDPPILLMYKAGGGIHSSRFGHKFQERAKAVGATVYLMAPDHKLDPDYPHKGAWTFIIDRLTQAPEKDE